MLRIGGIEPFSTVDWPGRLCCVAFLAGCPWDCAYCQNPGLRMAGSSRMGEGELLEFLERRRSLLDAVVFSGGEPLAQEGVARAAERIRELGFQCALHTCGAFPARLREALPHLDWVGLDVKAPWDAYERVTGVVGSGDLARQSLEALLDSRVPFEARTTWHPDLLSDEDLRAVARDLAGRGVRAWVVQAYRHEGTRGLLANRTVRAQDVPDDLPPLFDSFEFRRA